MKGGSRPTIGVTAATERVSYGVWEEMPAFISPARYVEAVQLAGGFNERRIRRRIGNRLKRDPRP